jgi:hypothetical protein
MRSIKNNKQNQLQNNFKKEMTTNLMLLTMDRI